MLFLLLRTAFVTGPHKAAPAQPADEPGDPDGGAVIHFQEFALKMPKLFHVIIVIPIRLRHWSVIRHSKV